MGGDEDKEEVDTGEVDAGDEDRRRIFPTAFAASIASRSKGDPVFLNFERAAEYNSFALFVSFSAARSARRLRREIRFAALRFERFLCIRSSLRDRAILSSDIEKIEYVLFTIHTHLCTPVFE